MSNRAAALLSLAAHLLAASTGAASTPLEMIPLRLSDRVLGLYDSSEPGGHGEKVLRERVGPALGRLGLRLSLHDVHRGLPRSREPRRAIITFFTDGRLRNAAAYCRWLAEQSRSGQRLVLLENFGAYQDAVTGRWTEQEELNRVFLSLGLQYDAMWTDDPSLFKVLFEDPKVLRPGHHFDPALTRHYYRFRAVAPEAVRAHVILDRRDVRDGRSLVVVTSAGGGMALSRYYEDRQHNEHLDLDRFLDLSLFPQEGRSGRLLVLHDPGEVQLLSNLRFALGYARLQADFLRISDAGALRPGDLRPYGAVAIAAGGDLAGAGGAAALIERWVREEGGGLIALSPLRHPALDPVFGILSGSGEPVRVSALRFGRALYPGSETLRLGGRGFFTHLAPLRLAPDVTLLAAAEREGGPPLIFRRRHGAGRAIYYNDGALADKAWRGTLLQLVMQAMKVAAAPVLGALIYFVDDCPMPMWGVHKDPVKHDLGLSDTAFYRDVFWPDLLRLAKEFSIKLTFAAIFSYDDRTRGGFTAQPFYLLGGEGAPLRLARDALRLGHEIGLHGYNHQSLVEHPAYTSRGWPSLTSMVEALKVARAEWQRVFGPGRVPFTYVAPNNHIDPLGKQALKLAFPEIRVLSALYLEDGPSKGQELGDDPDQPRLLALPRASSEFFLGEHNRQAILDMLMLTGTFSHFVHPDDVFDPERNGGMGWAALYREGRKMLRWLRTTYPWLVPMTAREAHAALLRFSTGSFHYEHTPEEVRLHLDGGASMTVVLHLDAGMRPGALSGARLLHEYPEQGYYYFSATGPVATIGLRR